MSSGHLKGEILWTFKKTFSSELKCLHYSNTNGRNYNIIIIIIIIIHLGLSPVQYNNKQNPFFKILLLETLLNVKCVYLHNLALYSFPFPLFLPLSVSHSPHFSVSLPHWDIASCPFLAEAFGGKKILIKYHNFFLKHSPWQPGT